MFKSKILNVTIRKPKIHFVPDVVYAQVPTIERPNTTFANGLADSAGAEKIARSDFRDGRRICFVEQSANAAT